MVVPEARCEGRAMVLQGNRRKHTCRNCRKRAHHRRAQVGPLGTLRDGVAPGSGVQVGVPCGEQGGAWPVAAPKNNTSILQAAGHRGAGRGAFHCPGCRAPGAQPREGLGSKKALQGEKTESWSEGGGKEGRTPQKLFRNECAHTSGSRGDRSPIPDPGNACPCAAINEGGYSAHLERRAKPGPDAGCMPAWRWALGWGHCSRSSPTKIIYHLVEVISEREEGQVNSEVSTQ